MSVILMPQASDAEKRNKIAAEINSMNFCGLSIIYFCTPYAAFQGFPFVKLPIYHKKNKCHGKKRTGELQKRSEFKRQEPECGN
jgi:hypothetical protein